MFTYIKKIKWKRVARKFFSLLKIVVMLGLFAFIGIFYALGERASDPDRFAQKYFEYFLALEFDKMYDMIEIEESTFINRQSFADKMLSDRFYGGVSEYKVQAPEKKEDGLVYTVDYVKRSNNIPGSMKITLIEQPEKTHLFFPTWKISINDDIINNCIISIPKEVDVNMNEISIEQFEKKDMADNEYRYYIIDRLFPGDHTLTAGTPYTAKISFSEYIDRDEFSFLIGKDILRIHPNDLKKIRKKSEDVHKKMIEAIMDEEQTYEDVKKLFPNKKKIQQIANQCFETFSNDMIREDGLTLTSIKIEDMNAYLYRYVYPSEAIIYIDYSYQYVAQVGAAPINGLRGSYEGSGKSQSILTFNMNNKNSWKITDIDLKCIDYSPPYQY